MRVARAELLDWYDAEDPAGESAVLVADQVIVLSALGTALVDLVDRAADGAAEVTALATELERQFGPPPDGDLTAAVEALVTTLVEAGVLRLDDQIG